MPCDVCDNNWVCETHPDKPSDITSDFGARITQQG